MLAFYAWLRRHPMLVDGLLALFVASFGLSLVGGHSHLRVVTAVPLGLAVIIPVTFRRKYPVGAFIAVVVAGALQVAMLPKPVGSDVSMLVMLYTLAAYRPRRTSVPGLIVCLVGAVVALMRWAPERVFHNWFTLGAVAAFLGGPVLLSWLLGDSMRWRRGFYRALEERAERAERERDAQAQVAAAAERARIARELHDVVAHNVSVMVVQADGAAFTLDRSPQRAREALTAISRTGRQALAEMRSLLGVLRTADDDPAQLAPQPGMDQLTGLLAQSRAAGLPVSFTVEGVPRPLPPGVALAAYRVVQESLTNTRKHGGPGVAAGVTLRFCEDGLLIKVTDDGRGSSAVSDGAGHGLAGMRERVEIYGGTVRSEPRPGGGYQVTVKLPAAAGTQGAA